MCIKNILSAVKVLWADIRYLRLSYALKDIIYRFLTRERRMSYGDLNPDKTFYVIRSIDDQSPFYIGPVHHLLANYFYVLSHIIYAKNNNYIPIIDQKNYPVYNKLDKKINNTDNPWEYFWEQPCAYSLEEVYKSKNVILSKQSWKNDWNLGYSIEKHRNPLLIGELNEAMKNVPLKKDVKIEIEKKISDFFPLRGKVLGVAYRFAGYSLNSPIPMSGHPIQMNPEELIKVTEKKYKEWNADYIFVSSDEAQAIELFKAKFGNKLLYLKRLRRKSSEKIPKGEKPRMYKPDVLYETSLNYLTEMELLARCDMLLGSISTGLRYALVRNANKFERVELLDNGFIDDYRLK